MIYPRPQTRQSVPSGSGGKESAFNSRDPAWIPGLGRSPGERNSYPLNYSCLENSMDRETWQVTVRGVAKTCARLSDFHFNFTITDQLKS